MQIVKNTTILYEPVSPQPPIAKAQSAITSSVVRVRGCVAMVRRHSLLGLHCLLIYNLTDKQEFICI